MPSLISALAGLALSGAVAQATVYPRVEQNTGASFFDNFDFYDNYDNTTSGDVVYVNSSSPLASVNAAGNAVIKVDTGKVIYDNKRDSVRITQKSSYDVGTVWVFDAVHMPYGCSVWPAYWTKAPGTPIGGEIDVLEGTSLQSVNQMAMHTVAGCTPVHDSAKMTGTVGQTSCNSTDNAGCTAFSPSGDDSYGEAFAQAGGGVFVHELAEEGVSIWFISRPNVPSTLNADATSIDTSTLGTPTAFWPSNGCSPISDYFFQHQAVINIALCGVWAGTADSLSQNGCAAPVPPESCYTTYVLNGNEAFSTAYFEVKYLNVFSSSTPSSASASASASVSSVSGTQSARPVASSSAAAVGSSGGGGSGAFSKASIGGGALVAAAIGAVGFWVAF